ncbi:hypothetical protein ACHM05_06510 [Staphylococcus aureus]|uniref:hypothetical protein n=1 Tax=Staphylococcus aureus TaxID=1280 RepID=UPI0037544F51
MDFSKALRPIIKVWTITTLIAGIIFIVQELTIEFADENKYFSLLFDRENNVYILIASLLITIGLTYFSTSKIANTIDNEKDIKNIVY